MTPIHLAARVALGLEPGLSLTVRRLLDDIELTIDLDTASPFLWTAPEIFPLDPIAVSAQAWVTALASAATIAAPPPHGVAKSRRRRMVRTAAIPAARWAP